MDNEPSYGEVPGTEAYQKREHDAHPDEIAVIGLPETSDIAGSPTPGGQPIPITIVERVDDTPSYGEVPGTPAHKAHAADAVPDLVLRSGSRSRSNSTRSRANSTPGDLPIPTTRVERVDSEPRHGEVPGTEAYEVRKGDAKPDEEVEVGDVPGMHISHPYTSARLTGSGSPTVPESRSPSISPSRRKSSSASTIRKEPEGFGDYDEEEDGNADGDADGFGDDFDDFEDGGEDAEFGDFDDGFQEPEAVALPPPQSIPIAPAFVSREKTPFRLIHILHLLITTCQPVLDYSFLNTSEDVQGAAQPYINALFPPDTIETSILPTPAPSQNPIFLTDRSASLWTQLVAPPPLQPPDWIRSRIRRAFLVSLGVPVDLDEILPASTQKKLILPSIHLNVSASSPRTSTDARPISRLKSEHNASSTSLDSQGKPRSDSRRRRGPPPVPQLDLNWARQLCGMTEQARDGLTVDELKEHIKKLEGMVGTANEVLDHWTKETDRLLGEREAFEGVIENLVKHARKTRK